jgi:hypothetical protein
MLVGVFHFAQQDTARFDPLSPARTSEIEALVERLARFQPTKVMVEWQPYFRQRFVDSTYALYGEGRFRLGRNEVYQLGYRLAHRVGLGRVYTVDHAGYWLGDTVRTVAASMGQQALLDGTAPYTTRSPHDVFDSDANWPGVSVAAYLRWLNTPEYQRWMHNGYINGIARVGLVEGDERDMQTNRAAADLLGYWYLRNINIYRMVLNRTTYERDRIVLFIGSDHVHTLKQFFEDNDNFRVVEANEYL